MKWFCIYCFEDKPERSSKAHIFPRSLGGRFWYDQCCESCNSVLGRSLESQVKDSLFLAFGIDRFAMVAKEDAFGQLQISHDETGVPIRFSGDTLIAKPRLYSDGTMSGNKEYVSERILDHVRKSSPNLLQYSRERLSAGEKTVDLPGERLIIRTVDIGGKIKFVGRTVFPVNILAKIVFEAMFSFGVYTNAVMRQFYETTFTVFHNGEHSTRIEIKDDFRRRVGVSGAQVLASGADLTKVDYQPFHRIDFRVNSEGIAYVIVNFFEALSFLVVVGEANRDKVFQPELLTKRIIFPFPSSVGNSEHKLIIEELLDRHAHRHLEQDEYAVRLWKSYIEFSGKSKS